MVMGMTRRRGFGGGDLVKLWLLGAIAAAGVWFSHYQVASNPDAPASMILGPFLEGMAPLFVSLGVLFGVILIAATAVYLVRLARV